MVFQRADKKKESEEAQDTPSGVPDDAIPADEVGLGAPPKSNDMVSMRLSSEALIHQLWRAYCGRTYRVINGKGYMVRIRHVTPVVNEAGAMRITNWVRSLANPINLLGHTEGEQAFIILEQRMEDIADVLSRNKNAFEIKSMEDQRDIASTMRQFHLHALTRAVDGRESEALITNIEETRGQQDIKQTVTSSGKGLGWSRNAGRAES